MEKIQPSQQKAQALRELMSRGQGLGNGENYLTRVLCFGYSLALPDINLCCPTL